ncbi:MAG: aminotransferase class III-fold pyridoxal phosphate-dependent enzyme, partial [Parachlamydiaceae bacterium]
FITSSGAMAVENGLKVAFQYRYPAQRLLAFEHCFAGRTMNASQITDKASYREGLPNTLQIDYVPFYENESSTKLAVDAIRKYTQRYPKQHAAMIIELVQGEGGFNTAPRCFYLAIIEALKEAGVLVFIDEIQTFGRLYQLFGFRYFELEEYVDIVSIGKMSQICATLFTEKVKPRLGLLSQTFTSSSVAIQTSSTIIKRLLEGNYYGEKGRIAEIHHQFKEGLLKIANKHEGLVEGPFGLGGMIAFTAYKGDNKLVLDYLQRLFKKGVIAFSAGVNPTRVRLLVPLLTITDEDIKQVLAILEDALI